MYLLTILTLAKLLVPVFTLGPNGGIYGPLKSGQFAAVYTYASLYNPYRSSTDALVARYYDEQFHTTRDVILPPSTNYVIGTTAGGDLAISLRGTTWYLGDDRDSWLPDAVPVETLARSGNYLLQKAEKGLLGVIGRDKEGLLESYWFKMPKAKGYPFYFLSSNAPLVVMCDTAFPLKIYLYNFVTKESRSVSLKVPVACSWQEPEIHLIGEDDLYYEAEDSKELGSGLSLPIAQDRVLEANEEYYTRYLVKYTIRDKKSTTLACLRNSGAPVRFRGARDLKVKSSGNDILIGDKCILIRVESYLFKLDLR